MSKNSCVRVSRGAGFISFRHDANDHICPTSASCVQLRMPPYLSTGESTHTPSQLPRANLTTSACWLEPEKLQTGAPAGLLPKQMSRDTEAPLRRDLIWAAYI